MTDIVEIHFFKHHNACRYSTPVNWLSVSKDVPYIHTTLFDCSKGTEYTLCAQSVKGISKCRQGLRRVTGPCFGRMPVILVKVKLGSMTDHFISLGRTPTF